MGKLPTLARVKVDLVAQKLVREVYVNRNRLSPMLHVEAKVLQELSMSWREALVVKLLGKTLVFNIMKAKLSSTWKLIGGFEIMDVGNGYFMVLFDEAKDRNKVISGGQWMIFDHILLDRLWTPELIANRATIDRTVVWVCIPSLNILFYDESFLPTLASAIGTSIKGIFIP